MKNKLTARKEKPLKINSTFEELIKVSVAKNPKPKKKNTPKKQKK